MFENNTVLTLGLGLGIGVCVGLFLKRGGRSTAPNMRAFVSANSVAEGDAVSTSLQTNKMT